MPGSGPGCRLEIMKVPPGNNVVEDRAGLEAQADLSSNKTKLKGPERGVERPEGAAAEGEPEQLGDAAASAGGRRSSSGSSEQDLRKSFGIRIGEEGGAERLANCHSPRCYAHDLCGERHFAAGCAISVPPTAHRHTYHSREEPSILRYPFGGGACKQGVLSIRRPRGALLTHFELYLEKPHTSFRIKINGGRGGVIFATYPPSLPLTDVQGAKTPVSGGWGDMDT